ncbi:MAG: pyridoxal kinase [Alphaproteobacteria bacterium]
MQGVLSIQSQVVFGHVGNSAAQFALQCLGLEVWGVPTVLYSNHPGHGGFAGAPVPATTLDTLITGLAERDLLRGCRAVLSGYLGAADHVDAVARAVGRARSASPQALFCCDPVMGDTPKGTYVRPGIPEGLAAHLVPLADILTPNAFELGLLTGAPITDPATALQAARTLPCPVTVVTSVPVPAQPGRLGCLAATAERAWLCSVERLEQVPPGTGDLFAALFLGHVLRAEPLPIALGRAAGQVDAVLRFRPGNGTHGVLPEMPLIDAQAAFKDDLHAAVKPVEPFEN